MTLGLFVYFFFFNDTATTEIYTLSLHDALPILIASSIAKADSSGSVQIASARRSKRSRSEEHTSELQSRKNLVCRLLLEKKKNPIRNFFASSFWKIGDAQTHLALKTIVSVIAHVQRKNSTPHQK